MAQSPAREIHCVRHLRERQPPVVIIANKRSYVCDSWVHRGASKDIRTTNRLFRTQKSGSETLHAPDGGDHPQLVMRLMLSFHVGFSSGELRSVVVFDHAKAERDHAHALWSNGLWARTKLRCLRLLVD